MFSKNPQLLCNKFLHTRQWNMFLLPSPINCHTVAQVHIHLSSEHLTHGTKPLNKAFIVLLFANIWTTVCSPAEI